MVIHAISDDNFQDIEDSLQIECAAKENLDYIVTRDLGGFNASKVPAVSPQEFLNILKQ